MAWSTNSFSKFSYWLQLSNIVQLSRFRNVQPHQAQGQRAAEVSRLLCHNECTLSPNSLEYIRIHPKLVARLRNDKWLSVRTQKPMANLLSHPGSLSGQGGRCPEQLLKWYPDCVLVALVTSLATPPCTVFLLYLCHLFFWSRERERDIYNIWYNVFIIYI